MTLKGIEIFERDVQFENAFFPIFLTLFGIEIFVRDEHPEKAYFPIFFTLFGIKIEIKEELKKAYFDIYSILFVIMKLLKEVKSNFELLTNLTDWGISILHKYFLPNTIRLLKLPITFEICILLKFDLLNKNDPGSILLPIFLILFGIVRAVSDVHPEKAFLPIFITLFGIEIFQIFH